MKKRRPMSEKPPIEEREGSVYLHLRVQPCASRNRITQRNGRLCVALTAPPVDGKANKALCNFFAKWLQVPRRTVQLVSGERSRDKTLLVESMSANSIQKKLKKGNEGVTGD